MTEDPQPQGAPEDDHEVPGRLLADLEAAGAERDHALLGAARVASSDERFYLRFAGGSRDGDSVQRFAAGSHRRTEERCAPQGDMVNGIALAAQVRPKGQ